MRRALSPLLALLALLATFAVAALLVGPTRAQEDQTTFLGDLISRALSTPESAVRVGAVDGALSSDATIRDIVVSDRDGPWLRVDRARLVWRRLALLQRRLEVQQLEIGRIEFLRKPRQPDAPPPPAEDKAPLLPELPVQVEIQRFAIGELALGEPILGAAATLKAEGAAKLGAPAQGLDLTFKAERMDQPGLFGVGLKLVPATQALTLAVKFDEPEGGLAARALALPGLPPVKLDLDGKGTLDAFAATLAFSAGPTIGATGRADLTRQGAARRLGLDMTSRIEGLLPPLLAPVFAGDTTLSGAVLFADTGALSFDALAVQSQTARLDVGGTLDAQKIADLTIRAAARPTEGGATRAGDARIGKLALEARVTGPVATPTVVASFDLADAALPAGRLAAATGALDIRPALGPPGAPAPMRIKLDAEASGLKPADPALARALGARASFKLAAQRFDDGTLDIEMAKLDGEGLDASFAGRSAPKALQGRLDFVAPDLSRFAALAGLDLRGRARGSVALDGAPAEQRYGFAPDVAFDGLATGVKGLDGALGGEMKVQGRATLLPAGGYAFSDLRVTGKHLAARLDGTATRAGAAVDLTAEASDLARIDARLTGRATLAAKITGSVARPDATFRIEAPAATALGRPIERLILAGEGRDLLAAPQIAATLDGRVGGKPATGRLTLARAGASDWRVEPLDVTVGSVSAKGGLTLSAGLAEGALTIAAGDLADIAPLILTPASGDFSGEAKLSHADGRQAVALKANSRALRLGETRIERLAADLAASGLPDRPRLSGTLSADRIEAAGEAATGLRLVAQPSAQGSALTLVARARQFDVSAAGDLGETRLDLARLTAQRPNLRIALAAPTRLDFADGLAVSKLALAVAGGRVELDGRVTPRLDLTASARALPLSVVDAFKPGTGLAGTLDAEARLTGAPDAPQGPWRVSIQRFSAPPLKSNGIAPAAVEARGELAGEHTTLEARVSAGREIDLKASGRAPLSADGALDLAFTGKVDLSLANRQIAAAGRRLSGLAVIDARLTGRASAPAVAGGAQLSGGAFSDDESGVKLTNIAARVTGDANRILIRDVSARARNGGTVTASGEVRLDAAAGFPGQIEIRANEAELMASDVATAIANARVSLSGPLARRPAIAGRVDFTRLDVTIPERLPGNYQPIAKARHIAPPPQARARLAKQAKAKKGKGGRPAPAFDATLNLVVAAANRVFVRGRGVDAELAGELKLTGSLADPVPVGGFELRRGRIAVAGKRLDFTRGRVAFTGSLTPDLDFLAATQAVDATLQIALNGPANEPNFAFSSEPSLPDEEILSRLLFNKASGGLSAGQALQLALVAAQFASGGGGDAFERVRKQFGLDSLDVNLGSGGVGVGASKAVNERLSVGVRAGSTPADTGVSVDFDATRNIRLRGEATSDGAAGVGLTFEKEY